MNTRPKYGRRRERTIVCDRLPARACKEFFASPSVLFREVKLMKFRLIFEDEYPWGHCPNPEHVNGCLNICRGSLDVLREVQDQVVYRREHFRFLEGGEYAYLGGEF